MRGIKYLSFTNLPDAVYEIPGVRKTKKGNATLIPWHASHLVRELNGGSLGHFKQLDPPRVYTPLLLDPDALLHHPFASETAKQRATAVQREDLPWLISRRGGILDWPCGSGKTLMGLLFATAWEGRALVLTPSTTVTQWRDEAVGTPTREGWLTPDVRIGYVTQGLPDVRRHRSITYTVTDEALVKLRQISAPEVLRLKPVWDDTELEPSERHLLKRAGAARETIDEWRLLDDLGLVLSAYETREEALAAQGTWSPGDYDVLCVGWGLLANKVVLDALVAWGPQIVIVDEAHRLRGDGSRWRKLQKREEDGTITEEWERKTSAASNVALLCEQAAVVLEMTATPQADRPIDWWSILDAYDPKGFGTRHEFGVRYADGRLMNKAKGVDAWDYSGVSREHLRELKSRMELVCKRRFKSETHKGLPQLITVYTNLDMKQAGKVDFEGLTAELRGNGEVGNSKTMVQIAIASEMKISWAVDRLKEHLREGLKVVVLTMLRSSANRIVAALREALPNALLLHGDGGTPMPERRHMVQQLVASQTGGVLVGTLLAWGEAIDGMQHVDRAMVLTIPWTPHMLQQARGRFERLGGEHSVIFEVVRMLGTYDDRIWDLVGDKLLMVGDVRDDDEASAIGHELKGDSPEAEAQAISSLCSLLDTWESERDLRDLYDLQLEDHR